LIYDNGAPNQDSGDEATHWIEAEDFTFAAPAIITDVRFWSVEGTPGYNGSITWTIYNNGVNQPGTAVATGNTALVTRTPTGMTCVCAGNNYTEVQNDFSIGPVALATGTYWLGMHNGPLTHDTLDHFYWETTNVNTTITGRSDETPFHGNWQETFYEH